MYGGITDSTYEIKQSENINYLSFVAHLEDSCRSQTCTKLYGHLVSKSSYTQPEFYMLDIDWE